MRPGAGSSWGWSGTSIGPDLRRRERHIVEGPVARHLEIRFGARFIAEAEEAGGEQAAGESITLTRGCRPASISADFGHREHQGRPS